MPQHNQSPRPKPVSKVARQGTGTEPNRGSGSALLLISLAILLGAGVATWFLLGPKEAHSRTETVQQGAAGAAEALPEPPPGMMREADLIALEAGGPRPRGGITTRPAGGYEPFEKVFGAPGGTVKGEIRVEGADYPETWTLTIEPSLSAQGREEAVTRTFTSEPLMRTFELRDLPLAAYRLSATAPGLSTSKVEVALYRVAGRPGERGLDFVTVDLTLRPMARVEGFVRQANGDPAGGLAVHLVPYLAPGAAAKEPTTGVLQTATNSAGSYLFENTPPGPWMLHVGDPIGPLTSPIPIGVGTQDQRVDDLTLPPLATLELVVLDGLARPCPDVQLTGYLRGAGKGHFKAVTGPMGRVEIHYLTPGPWRVDAEDPLLEQKGRGDYSLMPDDPTGGAAGGRINELHIK